MHKKRSCYVPSAQTRYDLLLLMMRVALSIGQMESMVADCGALPSTSTMPQPKDSRDPCRASQNGTLATCRLYKLGIQSAKSPGQVLALDKCARFSLPPRQCSTFIRRPCTLSSAFLRTSPHHS